MVDVLSGSRASSPTRVSEREAAAIPRDVWWSAGAQWAATRVALFLVGFMTVALIRFAPDTTHLGHSLFASWEEWDTNWYLIISRLGYVSPRTTAFFPLYPKLIALVMILLGHAGGPVYPALDALRLAVGLVIANLAALAGFAGVGLLAWHETRSLSVARRSVLLLSAYPLAFFLGAAYSEPLFLALAAFALYFARRGRWVECVACAFFAGLTRPVAAALPLPLLYEFGRQQGLWQGTWWRTQMSLRARIATVLGAVGVAAAVPAAVALYMVYLWRRFGDPLVFVRVQHQYWHRSLVAPWTMLHEQLSAIFHHYLGLEGGMALLDLGAPLAVVVIALVAAKRQPLAFTLYALLLVLLSVLSPRTDIPDVLASVSRFMTAAVPSFLVGAELLEGRPELELALVVGGFMLQAVLLIAFLNGHVPGF